LSLLAGTTAWADQVTLTNGDRLTGRIVELDAETLRFQTELMGEVRIPRQAIASLASDQELAVTLPDGQVTVGTVAAQDNQAEVRTDAEKSTIALDDMKAVRTPENQAKYERWLHPRWFENWQLGLNTALSARGGGGTVRLSLGLELERITRDDELTVLLHSLRETEKKGSVVNDNKTFLAVLYAHDITPRWYYLGSTYLDRDALQNLALRWELGGGLGWRARESDRLHFDLVGGGGIDSEHFQDRSVRRSGEAFFGQDLEWQIAPRMYLHERWMVYPNLSRGGEYRTRLSATLETKLNNWLSWQLTLSNHYLSDPPPETDKNDLLITSGLRVTLGRREEGRIKLRPR
jgi:hypothetical protein